MDGLLVFLKNLENLFTDYAASNYESADYDSSDYHDYVAGGKCHHFLGWVRAPK